MNSAFFYLTKREILRFLRQKSRLIGALLTPLLFWAILGGGLGRSFQDVSSAGAQSYVEFFFPGALALSVLFTAIFATISVIEDRHEGFMQAILVSPVPRSMLVLSKIVGASILGVLQALLLMAFAPLAGLYFDGLNLLLAIVILFLMAASMTSLGFFFAWKLDSVQGYHGIMNTVLMPMWILSGAVFPVEGSSTVFQWIAKLNPLSYGMIALKGAFAGEIEKVWMIWPLLVFGACLYVISVKLADSTRD